MATIQIYTGNHTYTTRSFATIEEALEALAGEGWVEVDRGPSIGTVFVRTSSIETVREVQEDATASHAGAQSRKHTSSSE
jgi:hypothetical protein